MLCIIYFSVEQQIGLLQFILYCDLVVYNKYSKPGIISSRMLFRIYSNVQ